LALAAFACDVSLLQERVDLRGVARVVRVEGVASPEHLWVQGAHSVIIFLEEQAHAVGHGFTVVAIVNDDFGLLKLKGEQLIGRVLGAARHHEAQRARERDG
jgi:hypothetical protein